MKKFEKMLGQHPRGSDIEASLTENMLHFYPGFLEQVCGIRHFVNL